jgi:pilus assembly protein CpaB
MSRRLVGVLVAVGLTLFGTVLLVGYVNGAEDRAVAGERMVDVLVVAQPVKRSTPAKDLNGKVEVQRVPARLRAESAVSDLASLRGLVNTADLAVGELLVRGRFARPGSLDVAGAVETKDLVKMSALLDQERAVGGQLKVGDLVAVVISAEDRSGTKVSKLTLHQVPVVSVRGALVAKEADEEEKKGGSSGSGSNSSVMVTLGLTEPQAGELAWGLEHGSIWLTLEPTSADQSGTETVTAGKVFE